MLRKKVEAPWCHPLSPENASQENAETTLRESRCQEAHHFLDRVDLLDDWKHGLDIQVRRAELLSELGLLDEQAIEALEWRVGIWRDAVSAFGDARKAAA
jgi:hypothetical protein